MLDKGLVDRIYEAGALPELWPGVLQEITDLVGGLGTVLWTLRTSQWVATPAFDPMVAEFVEPGLAQGNARTGRLLAMRHQGFVTDQDIFPLHEIPNEPVYRDFFIPRGGGLGVATAIEAPSGDLMVLHSEKDYAEGPVSAETVMLLDGLRPHLARAALLSSRLELQRAEAAAAILDLVGLPAARHQVDIGTPDPAFRRLVPPVDVAHLVVVDHEIGAAIAALQNARIGEKLVLERFQFEGLGR